MAIKSSIFQKKDDKLNTLDSGKNPKTLEQKNGFQRYIHAVADQVGNGDPIASEKKVIDYTKKYHPGSVADVTEYYAGFKSKPTNVNKDINGNPISAQKTAQTHIPEKVKPVVNTSPSTPDTSTETTPETSTGTNTGATTDKVTGENENGSYYFETYDELIDFINNMKGQAGEAHDIYKGNNTSANAYISDYAQFLQDIRDVIMGEAQANPLETDWGKSILDHYGVLGENSANAVNAATAGENAGNIDSFAAANAERQRLSRYGQGVQSVMGMSTERFNNMINGLNAIGVNTDILFGGQQGITDTSANYAASLYGTDADSTAAHNQLLADIESGSNPYVKLDEEQVMSALKDAYMAASGDTDASTVDWANTDDEIWAEALKDLGENEYIKQLGSTYLKTIRNKIKGQTTK